MTDEESRDRLGSVAAEDGEMGQDGSGTYCTIETNSVSIARTTVRALLDGTPTEVKSADCGAWAEVVAALLVAHVDGGAPAARRAFDALARDDLALAALVAGDDDTKPGNENAPPGEGGAVPPPLRDEVVIPPLPECARLPDGLGRDASPWLDRYIGFSRKWSPRAFEGFHEACGLWLLSTVAARRVVLHLGKPRFTPLYIALAARTSLYAKTTTADIAIDTLGAAGLDWLLAADDATPQSFIHDLTAHLPEDYYTLQSAQQDRVRLRLAQAGQRGWFYEEFGQHLDAMNRDGGFMAEFRGILRRFDDCKMRYEYGTLKRGKDVIERPYLALLANVTPADLKPLAKRGGAMWNDGFWARFSFVTPRLSNRSRERFPLGERVIPPDLSRPIREWHERLGVPTVTVSATTDEESPFMGKNRIEVEGREPVTCGLGDGVYESYYRYTDGLLDIVAQSRNTDLDGNYARFSEKALRIAILLVSLENGDKVEMVHWARGQEITERWRAGLHALFVQVNEPDLSEDARNEERILEVVARLGWPTVREIKQSIRGLSTGAIRMHLENLGRADVVTEHRTTRTVRYGFPSKET